MLPPRYKFKDENAMRGGYGTVHLVHDTYLDRTVLFKSMQDEENNQQLINEVQHLSRARSRHVVEIYDTILDASGNIKGIIIEYLDGRDYSTFHLESGDAEKFIRVLYQIAAAISDLHSFDVIHRDLKLDNLKSSASGILKIFDFGISSPGTDYYTKDNRGTYVYAAPELFKSGAKITPSMDVYAIGVCAWALAHPIFPVELNQIPPQSIGIVPSIKTVMPKLPEEVVGIIDKCLRVDPDLRPSSTELKKLLAKHLVRDKHRGLFVEEQREIYELSNEKRNVTLTVGNLGKINIVYNGVDFEATPIEGYICINNKKIDAVTKLPEACVFTFGPPELGPGRQWLTFSSSRPEIVL